MRQNNLNVSETAAALFTSQPGVSKQIKLLEGELGVELFDRSGKQIVAETASGSSIIDIAEQILASTDDIKNIGREYNDPNSGDLRLATTHTQARYVLPSIIEAFSEQYPRVNIQLHQGTPKQMASMIEAGEVDFVIATEGTHHYNDLVMLPCSRWNRCVVVPPDHALFKLSQLDGLTLEALVNYPIITYVFGFTGRSQLDKAFAAKALEPNVVLTAADADVIKTYVRSGLGVGIIAKMAYETDQDHDLKALEASHLFESSVTHIGMRRNRKLRPYMYAFIEQFASHLGADQVDAALQTSNRAQREYLFADIKLPVI
ncbi:UNVERIFIED_CONTAM: hypothetical protein GTU68_040513 [Idotea baltica]|nr:hypothetical protein [Idotea baltica]